MGCSRSMVWIVNGPGTIHTTTHPSRRSQVMRVADHTFKLTRSYSSRCEPTANVLAMAAAFGLGVDEAIRVDLYRDLPVTLGPGRIIYITGESGAGKSSLMRDLKGQVMGHPVMMAFGVTNEPDDKPLVDQFGDMPLKDVGELLAAVGISEAFVMLRKPAELSDGQRYRFMLARLIHLARWGSEGRLPVVFADEFGATLDRLTARNVAYQTRRVASKHGICFVVATTHTDLAEDLQADLTITMRLNQPPRVKT